MVLQPIILLHFSLVVIILSMMCLHKWRTNDIQTGTNVVANKTTDSDISKVLTSVKAQTVQLYRCVCTSPAVFMVCSQTSVHHYHIVFQISSTYIVSS